MCRTELAKMAALAKFMGVIAPPQIQTSILPLNLQISQSMETILMDLVECSPLVKINFENFLLRTAILFLHLLLHLYRAELQYLEYQVDVQFVLALLCGTKCGRHIHFSSPVICANQEIMHLLIC